MIKKKSKSWIGKKIVILIFWLLLWQIVAFLIDNPILLEGPLGVLKRLIEDLKTKEYYMTILASLIRINGGFLLGMFLAILFSIWAWKMKWLKALLAPLVQFLKSAPIACFIVLILIWTGSDSLSIYISMLVTFPPIYLNLSEGLSELKVQDLEVALVFKMPFVNRLKYIYFPAIKPHFISAVELSIGMAFKSAIAAEIIGTPEVSMGERIYMSKIYLDTAGVLSWMITVIFLAFLCEKIYMYCVNRILEFSVKTSKVMGEANHEVEPIVLCDYTVAYNDEKILNHVNVEFVAGKVYAITGKSGIGKTTLLRGVLGLIKQHDGTIYKSDAIKSVVFQEDRLFTQFSAMENVAATGRCTVPDAKLKSVLAEILPAEALLKPVSEYSGGMKRRVAIARAILSDGDVVLLDEPFNGLDRETKEKVISFIVRYQNNRTVLFTTHNQEDIELMGGEEIVIWKNE